MSQNKSRKGSCLCGAVTVNAHSSDHKLGACHCSMCRNWGGGPLQALDCGSEVSFEGESNIKRFSSSEWAERGFCSQCGTHLFYRLKQNNQHIMPVGIFSEVDDVVFDHQIFIDKKPSYYEFSNDTKNMTEEEVFAQYAPPE
ncbi:GFA family protein [Aliikangiella coralliicola]|uniref:GFA family protein n=1 Tax=Aliikangiella coralliicola TaxID=2592383 RepID=A0A545UF60_9GAMM|nr:GFA family protein [Aliikangiella coralliicola]TQV88107.1 GFA family protein [Aliikangiella coralliicola]